MKNFSAYFHETNKVYEFRIKMAHVEPKGEVLDRIKNALDCFQVETISAVKRLPITEHWEFSNEGACECYIVDVGVKYPTIPGQIRQLIGERAAINPSWINVRTVADALNEEAGWEVTDSVKSPLLTQEDLGGESAQEVVGEKRLSGLIKELSANTRKHEIAGTDNEYASGKTTNDIPQHNVSAIGGIKGQK
jgi:hypothetical protein